MKSIAYVGLDVHQDTITVAVLLAEGQGYVEERKLENREPVLRKYFRKLNERYELSCGYEASGGGYVIQRWLGEEGIACSVIAPSKTPVKPGEKVKTDRRDARKLARLWRAGELTAIHLPTEQEEAVRGLVRCRETFVKEVVRAKNYVLKFLAGRGVRYEGKSHWTQAHWKYLKGLTFAGADQVVWEESLALLEHLQGRLTALDRELEQVAQSEPYREAVGKLCCLRGVGVQTALVLIAETIDFERFGKAGDLMGYWGLVPSEESSGQEQHKGPITQAGNSRCRRVLTEAAWHYRHQPGRSPALQQRQQGQPAAVIAHAWKAQQRLHKTFWRIALRKEPQKAVVAVARELAGFVWAIMTNQCGMPQGMAA